MSNYMNNIFEDDMKEPKEIEVTVSFTISKTVKINVQDYTVTMEEDELGKYPHYDFSSCDLKQTVLEQIDIPFDDKNWDIDDFEVIM